MTFFLYISFFLIGIFGFIGICLAMIPLNYIKASPPFANNSRGTLEASIDALIQIGNSTKLLIAIIGQIHHFHFSINCIINTDFALIVLYFTGIVFSIAFFNFAGISVTKEMNATTRMILDSVRTVVIWVFSLAVGWQVFHYMQV